MGFRIRAIVLKYLYFFLSVKLIDVSFQVLEPEQHRGPHLPASELHDGPPEENPDPPFK